MKPVLIQPVGPVDYSHLDKPVHFTPEFLAGLTGKHSFDVHNEHHGPLITTTTELFYMDGGLYAIFNDEIDTKNKGFSTRFDAKELIEYEDHYEPLKCPILSIDQSVNPRNMETFLYNSSTIVTNAINDSENKKEDNMTKEDNNLTDGNDTAPSTSNKDEKIGALKYETNNHKDKINLLKKDLKTKEDELTNVKSDKEKLEENNKKLSDELKIFQDAEKAKTEQLAQELAGKNETLLETYKKLTLEDLEKIKTANEKHDKYIAEKISKDRPYKGVPGTTANELNKNDKNPEKDKDKDKDSDKWSREKFDEHKKAYGVY